MVGASEGSGPATPGSGGGATGEPSAAYGDGAEPSGDPPVVEELVDDLEELTGDVGAAARGEIRELEALLAEAHVRGLVDSGVRRLDPGDAAQAFVGSVIFASPLLVEDGVFDIAAHLSGAAVGGVPVFLVANTLFVVLMTYALVEWTGRDKAEADLLFGAVPARVVMTLVVSFLVAALLMTVWGRVDGWRSPAAAVARINVLWTVGSLGAALGDILGADDERPTAAELSADWPTASGERAAGRDPDRTGEPRGDDRDVGGLHDAALLAALHDQFEHLVAAVDGRDERREVERIRERANRAAVDELVTDRIRKYTGRDVAEAFVGSIFFSIPFLVEDGVFDVADYFLSFRVGQFPVFFLANAAFVLLMISALVYWAGPRDVQVTRPLLGVVPRRLVGIAVVSVLTAAALMTLWGRVDGWRDPVVAVARISAVWTVASFGAALGDILPGESSGDDINDDLAELGGRVEQLVDQTD